MDQKISVVINSLNEAENIEKAIKSVSWASEIIVCDMHSEDNTVEIAKRMGAKVIFHKKTDYVEPARNFAISKTSHEWIFVLDADEQVPASLSERIQQLIKKPILSNFVEISRKNIIFGKWIKGTGWWPDYQIRFFKKGAVIWQDKIHSRPQTKGVGLTLEPEEKWAIVHYNYQTVGQFIDRMNRYTQIQADELKSLGYKFRWQDLFEKPLDEFLSRFFAKYGYKDGLHGLSLSLLQAFSFLILYLKLWQMSGFSEERIGISEFDGESKKVASSIKYWIKESEGMNSFSKLLKIFKK